MRHKALLAALTVFALVGCRTTDRGMHTIPVARDYAKLPDTDIKDSAALIAHARRMGAPHTAPYAFYSAERYLEMAVRQKAEGDREGVGDYATLAKRMAEAAIGHTVTPAEIQGPPGPADFAEAVAEFERVKALYLDVDKDKAIEVAPVLYADLTVALSCAEHELHARQDWRGAAADIMAVEADLQTLCGQDTDEDGIFDLKDAAPLEAEDFDGFEDDDGAPDFDNDEDGIPDDKDLAPMEAETVNRFRDYDGKPDAYPVLPAVQFERRGAELSGEAKGYLRALALFLISTPELKLRVRGHSTDLDDALEDLDLSRNRVEAVQKCLLEGGVPEEQLVATFHGDTEPLPDVSNAELQRVEMIFE